eukprot:g685.t1
MSGSVASALADEEKCKAFNAECNKWEVTLGQERFVTFMSNSVASALADEEKCKAFNVQLNNLKGLVDDDGAFVTLMHRGATAKALADAHRSLIPTFQHWMQKFSLHTTLQVLKYVAPNVGYGNGFERLVNELYFWICESPRFTAHVYSQPPKKNTLAWLRKQFTGLLQVGYCFENDDKLRMLVTTVRKESAENPKQLYKLLATQLTNKNHRTQWVKGLLKQQICNDQGEQLPA